ncbi:adagio-like protein [Acrasis kona]|uniref:Adagio-like protein n=1 Tax=Acrasis kona TaxID=1008807 RepID=A0AAW2ZGU8_9EUKA
MMEIELYAALNIDLLDVQKDLTSLVNNTYIGKIRIDGEDLTELILKEKLSVTLPTNFEYCPAPTPSPVTKKPESPVYKSGDFFSDSFQFH